MLEMIIKSFLKGLYRYVRKDYKEFLERII